MARNVSEICLFTFRLYSLLAELLMPLIKSRFFIELFSKQWHHTFDV